jgi:hypothetical protein
VFRLLSGVNRRRPLLPMSHDLRRALTAVRGATGVAQEVASSDEDKERVVMIGHVQHLLMMMLKPVVPPPPDPGD